jgi:hypothetical protein
MRLYGAIRKFDTLDDGTLEVAGIASSEAVDDQGEIVTAAAMKAALPGYMALGGSGPLREMHQPLAAGKVTSAEVRQDGSTWIVARVVDPVACEKVRQGVYRGFSVAGKVLKREGKRILGLLLQEISLVDRPSCPTAIFKLGSAAMPLPRRPAPIVLKNAYATPRERETTEAAAIALIKATRVPGRFTFGGR